MSDEPASSSFWDKAKSYSGPFWFLRGVGGTFALLGIVVPYLGLETWHVARGVHAVFISWNTMMAWLGVWLANLINVPPIPEMALNFAALFFALVIPFAVASRKLFSSHALAFGFLLLLLASLSMVPFFALFDPTFNSVVGKLMMTSWLAFALFLTTRALPMYGKALFWTVSFLAAVEIAYWLPFVGDYIEAFADSVLGDDRPSADD